MRWPLRFVLPITLLFVACGDSPAPAPGGGKGLGAPGASAANSGGAADAGAQVGALPSLAPCTPDPTRIRDFPPCPGGGGVFGDWVLDRWGMPAFDYTFDELRDPRAAWKDSTGATRREHFHVSGNGRVHFMAVDDGYVQLFGGERGPTWMNRFAEDQKNLGGGFSYLKDGIDTWSSAYRYAPPDAKARRVFGIGYFETETTHGGLRVLHRIHAPFGDDPLLVDDVEITNVSAAPKSFTHDEYWDVNRHQLTTEWVRTGLGAAPSDNARDALNGRFVQQVTRAGDVLTATLTPKPGESFPARGEVSEIDGYPPPIFLARLAGNVSDVFADQGAYFGDGGVSAPVALVNGETGGVLAPSDGSGQPACLVMRSALSLGAGETTNLRFAFGYVPQGKSLAMLAPYGDANVDLVSRSLAGWRDTLAYAAVPGEPFMHRETAWRSHLLLAHSLVSEYYGERYTAQGSAYLYLHGADGVPRDQSLFAAATTYLDPALAKGNLRLVMGLTDSQTGEKTYAFSGNGVFEDATLHKHPSDLDIFFLFALGEYLAATGDHAFLSESVSFHPHGTGHPSFVSGDTVLDHARAAFYHLQHTVGLGPNGLVRISDGDWSDGICLEDPSPAALAFTTRSGESVPNSQMAMFVLPLAADLLAPADATLAADMHAFAAALAGPVRATFGTRWFARAWLRNSIDQGYLKGNDQLQDGFHANYIDLESQPWGILSGVLSPAEAATVVHEVNGRLDLDSPIGPRMREGGMVWPAISQLMTWAYARTEPALAWNSLEEQQYATHAGVWPAQWIGVLSAPDGFNDSPNDGGTWVSPVTPMTDFPVANMNPEAMWLLGLVRTAGVEPTSDGLVISPRRGGGHEDYALDLPLLRLDVTEKSVKGEYRARNDGSLWLHVGVGTGNVTATVRCAKVSAPVVDGRVKLPLVFVRGDRVPFEVTW